MINKRKQLEAEKYTIVFLWAALVLWRIPFLNKGIDYTDTGFSLTNYYNVFSGAGIHSIGTFLTTLLGGLIYMVLPKFQLLVFKILHWIIYAFVDIVTYRIFRKFIKPVFILFALLALSLGGTAGEAIFSYYPLTKALLIPAIGLLFKGCFENNKMSFFFSGFICGINIFVRLPNVFFCSMILCIVLYGIWNHWDKKKIIQNAAAYLLGVFSGFALILIFMIAYMGFDKVSGSFTGFVNIAIGKSAPEINNFLGIEEASDHSFLASIRKVLIQGVYALKDIAIFGLPMLTATFIIKRIIKNKTAYIVTGIVDAILLILFRRRISSNLVSIQVILMFSFSFLVFFNEIDVKHRLFYLCSLLLGIFCIFGSDLGLTRVSMLQGIVLLTSILGVKDLRDLVYQCQNKDKHVWIEKNVFAPALSIIILASFIVNLTVHIPKTYMDGFIKQMNYSVHEDIAVLAGMKTTEIRRDEINEYYQIMSNPKLSECEVAIFGYFPLGYVISDQKDYFESVQPCVDYPGVKVISLLPVIEEKAEKDIYPVIVLSKVNQIQRGDDHATSEAKMKVIDYMLSLTEYNIAIDDDFYTIYIPSSIL